MKTLYRPGFTGQNGAPPFSTEQQDLYIIMRNSALNFSL